MQILTRRGLTVAFCLAVTGPLHAVAQSSDDPATVSQLVEPDDSDPSSITTQQLNAAMTRMLSEGQIEQLVQGPSNGDIAQAEGGKDFCAPGQSPRYEFCEDLETHPLQAPSGKRTASRPEEDYAAGLPQSINRFSSDPALTADQIGRGDVSSFAAQSFAEELLNSQKTQPPPEEMLPSPSGLPPGVLDPYQSGVPVITEGN